MDLFSSFQGHPGMQGLQQMMRPPPHAFDQHYRAYSMAMLPGRQRDNVSYGGKIIMPPSALATITRLDLESPWMFALKNPQNAAASTHAGVLEFIADEGTVNLPQWMMKTLRLQEGDPIRLTGAQLPKGKFIKLQAQTVDFIEVSDPKAVLEQALRNFTCLTQGDMIEIIYNSIVFRLLVMETKQNSSVPPPNGGIAVFETDLEVDFATPVGYKEPVRPPPPPAATMASKLGIDVSEANTPGSSRPASALGQVGGAGEGGFEAFKGRGETLNGRKTKGKGKLGRKITDVDPHSKIVRTDRNRFITTDMLETTGDVPPALTGLQHGQLFFGYQIIPYTPPSQPAASTPTPAGTPAFQGGGVTLSGRTIPSTNPAASSSAAPSSSTAPPAATPTHDWGTGGQALGSASRASRPAASGVKKKKAKREIIEIDSD